MPYAEVKTLSNNEGYYIDIDLDQYRVESPGWDEGVDEVEVTLFLVTRFEGHYNYVE